MGRFAYPFSTPLIKQIASLRGYWRNMPVILMWQLRILLWRLTSREPLYRTPFMEAKDISIHPATKWSLVMVPHTCMDLRLQQVEVSLPIILLLSVPPLPPPPFGLVSLLVTLSLVPMPQVYRSWQPPSCDWSLSLFPNPVTQVSLSDICCAILSQTPQAPIEKSSCHHMPLADPWQLMF